MHCQKLKKNVPIKQIKQKCNNLLVHSPTPNGGNTNNGPTAQRFFHQKNREAICSLISNPTDRENYCHLLKQINAMLYINQQCKCVVDVQKVKELGVNFMLVTTQNFPWVYLPPSVHQMAAHSWELFEKNDGNPVSKWSEQGVEAWNKSIRAWKSGKSARSRQNTQENNIHDVFRRILISTHPSIAFRKKKNKTKPKFRPLNENEDDFSQYFLT